MPASFRDVTIIIPTLNEAANISNVIEELASLYAGVHMLMVDDDSDDKTPELVMRLSKRLRGVRLLSRKGKMRGLTASIIDGLKDARTDYVVIMDGDGQHPPEKVSELFRLLRDGCDIAVACRSSVPGWSIDRRLISLGAEALGRLRLFLGNTLTSADMLSGFFGIRRSFALEIYEVNSTRFVPEGYKFLFDLLKCAPRNARVCETAYVFGLRKRGASKIGLRQCLAFIKSLVR